MATKCVIFSFLASVALAKGSSTPTFDKAPANRAVVVGDSFILICAKRYPNVTVSRFNPIGKIVAKNGRVASGYVVMWTERKGKSKLYVNANMSSAGEYTCQAEFNGQSHQVSAHVVVIESAQLQCRQNSEIVAAGVELVLFCEVRYDGIWAPALEWKTTFHCEGKFDQPKYTTSSSHATECPTFMFQSCVVNAITIHSCDKLEVRNSQHRPYTHGIYERMSSGYDCDRPTYKLIGSSKMIYLYYINSVGGWAIGKTRCSAEAVIHAMSNAATPDSVTETWREADGFTWVDSTSLQVSCYIPPAALRPLTTTGTSVGDTQEGEPKEKAEGQDGYDTKRRTNILEFVIYYARSVWPEVTARLIGMIIATIIIDRIRPRVRTPENIFQF